MRPLREFDEEQVEIGGVPTRFLVAGKGRPMVLLHADGDNRLDWRWVLARLATHHRVYVPDLPGFGGTTVPPDCSPEFFEGFVHEFLDALNLGASILVGSSLGGLAALRLAMHAPDRVWALCLVSSAGLGSEVSVALRQMTVPGVGEAAIWWGQTGIGASQRLLLRLPLLFANPGCVPQPWLIEQYRLAQLSGFLDTTLAALRAQVEPKGQKQVLLNDLPRLSVPTLCSGVIATSSSPSAKPARQRGCCPAAVSKSSPTLATCRTWSARRNSWRRCLASSWHREVDRAAIRTPDC
jgi:pimeloyl-ACP methyl ester carboxylesterase